MSGVVDGSCRLSSGIEHAALTHNRRVKSTSSGLGLLRQSERPSAHV